MFNQSKAPIILTILTVAFVGALVLYVNENPKSFSVKPAKNTTNSINLDKNENQKADKQSINSKETSKTNNENIEQSSNQKETQSDNEKELNSTKNNSGEFNQNTTEKVLVTRVVDGDTIVVNLHGEDAKVRLIGIDTPEIHHPKRPVQCFGYEAKDFLEKLIDQKEVRLEKDVNDKDVYGRYLRYVWLDDNFINETLVKEGYAFAKSYPPDIKYQEKFKEAEQYARTNQEGLWSSETCNGNVEK